MKQFMCIRALRNILIASLVGGASQSVWAEIQPYNLTQGVTDTSKDIYDLHMIIYYICCAIGVVVFGAMIVSIYRDRKSRGVTPAKFHESTVLEIVWTTIPFFILIAIAIPSAAVLIHSKDSSEAEMTIKVTGYQWLWRYEYLDHDIDFYSVLSTPRSEIYNQEQKNENYLLEVDNELVLPTDRKIRFLITANDVIHSWWVPELAVKRDAVPGFINEAWTKINTAGVYRGQCAELCGRDHGFMPVVVRALPPEEFDAWVLQQNDKIAATAERSSTSLQQSDKTIAATEISGTSLQQNENNVVAITTAQVAESAQ